MTSRHMKPKKTVTKAMNSVERLIHSLESRVKTYKKNMEGISSEYRARIRKEKGKMQDALLQLRALKKK